MELPYVIDYESKANFEENYLNIIMSQLNLGSSVPNQTKIDTVKKALSSPNISLSDFLHLEAEAYIARML
ncbi:MAG: hypothetical protein HRU09_21265 [Oligoflexales bacterium]|nr:hypothetical protein [Oligoflexales bacterium]